MRVLELLAIFAALAAVVLSVARWEGVSPWAALACAAAALALVGALALMGELRWQMAPACVVIVVLGAALVWSPPLAVLPSVAGAIAGGALVLASAALAAGFSVRALPAPDGPHAVGVVATEITRPGDDAARRLIVKIWYPARAEAGGSPRETLWSELYQSDAYPAPMRVFTGYLGRVRTHSLRGAPLAADAGPFPVLVYNHGLVSFASDNTLLMEHLASHGYVVVSIQHADQQTEYAGIRNGLSQEETERDAALQAQLRRAATRAERARLSEELYAQSTGMPVIVERRARDTAYVADSLPNLLETVPGFARSAAIELDRVGALGLSLGGAVAIEFCNTDTRCAAAADMDGGLYGPHAREPLRAPALMLASEANLGATDGLKARSGDLFEEQVVPGSKHMDFHDAAVALPILRWFGLLGRGPGAEVNATKNERVRDFFDAHLKRDPLSPSS